MQRQCISIFQKRTRRTLNASAFVQDLAEDQIGQKVATDTPV